MRKYGFLFLSLILVAIFFAGFFLYYVPFNKETQDKYAFLVLKNIESNLASKIAANIELYKNNLKKSLIPGTYDNRHMKDMLPGLYEQGIRVLTDTNRFKDQLKIHRTSIGGQLLDITNDTVSYLIYNSRTSIILQAPLHPILDEMLLTHQNDFYDYFLFLKVEDNQAVPIYKSTGLELGTKIAVDTLLPGSRSGFYQGITEVPSDGIAYKLFYIPVNLSQSHYVMGGFKNAREYQNSLHEVSSGFIYPIVILLFLMLLILPLIKLSIMDSRELLKIGDLTGYFFSLFVGSMFIALIIIQVILLKDGDIRVHKNLQDISNQIDSGFQQEISKACELLKEVDLLPEETPGFTRMKLGPKDTSLDISSGLLNWLAHNSNKDSLYYNYDRISWSDTAGQQIIKGQIDKQPPVYTDISSRKYFKDIQSGDLHFVSGSDNITYTIEPVYNWIDGSYRIIVAMPSHCLHASVIQVSCIMYTFSQTVLPPGYGYAMIGTDGTVEAHADSTHNLNENFFDEIEDARALKGAMKARQELFIPESKFYGRKNALLMQPVANLPYYLITFYDTGNILPVNMRILIFSLLCCFISFMSCCVLWVILFRRRYGGKPLLFSHLYYLRWLIPRQKNTPVYYFSFLFLFLYLAALLLTSFLTNRYIPQNNHIVLILLLLTPVNISFGLIIIFRSLNREPGDLPEDKPVWDKKTWIFWLALPLSSIICMLIYQAASAGRMLQFFGFETLIIAYLFFIKINAPKLVSVRFFWKEKHLTWHTLLTEALVICLAVLPAGLYTWYAHNQEIVQAVKKDQLCLAFSIEHRNHGIYGELANLKPSEVPAWMIDTLKYRRGIYAASRQRITEIQGLIPPAIADSGYEKLYFDISDQISNNYYSEGFLPALKDTSVDRSWKWSSPSRKWLSFLYSLKPGYGRLLSIHSKIPQRFIFLTDFFKLAGLLIFVALLLVGLFFLIYHISEGIFLNKFVCYGSLQEPPGIPFAGDFDPNGNENLDQAVFEFAPVKDEKIMNQYEMQTIAKMQQYKRYYAFVLGRCIPMEKYLLYNFALNGFLNYKNVPEIYKLIDDGILKVDGGDVKLFSLGFRAYIIKYYASEAESVIAKGAAKRTAWQSFKTPFLILLIAVAAFIFFTRQEAWQRFSALITGLSTSIPLLIGLFRSGMNKSDK